MAHGKTDMVQIKKKLVPTGNRFIALVLPIC